MQKFQQRQPKLFEGLRTNDLKDQIDPLFTVDQYKSKMGEDKNVVVVAFKVYDKYPAIDLMEFIEKGYTFILDADMSTGEERDGCYQVFVEFERNKKIAREIKAVIEGVSQLCDIQDWKFKYYRDKEITEFTEDTISQKIPSSAEDYESIVMENKTRDVGDFFDQGHFESINYDTDQTITFKKLYSETVKLKLVALGEYEKIKNQLLGHIQLDETSRTQTIYLEKYLGNYEIHKINNQFLIRNGGRAAIVKRESW